MGKQITNKNAENDRIQKIDEEINWIVVICIVIGMIVFISIGLYLQIPQESASDRDRATCFDKAPNNMCLLKGTIENTTYAIANCEITAAWDCYITIGCVYTGNVIPSDSRLFPNACQRNGYGICKYRDDVEYHGEWKHNKKNGFGILVYHGVKLYEGQWENDTMNGIGWKRECRKYPSECGDSYCSGEFQNNERHGKMLCLFPDMNYTGYFAHDKKHGKGTLMWNARSSYEGEIVGDGNHGLGIEKSVFENTYEGEWSCDKRHGHGKLTFSNGNIYVGSFHEDAITGEGIYTSSTFEYSGHYIDGKKEGVGIGVWKNGTVYSGYWLDDMPMLK
jgi:hypothetical protein